MNNEEIWQMGGVKSYEVIDQIKADSDLSAASGYLNVYLRDAEYHIELHVGNQSFGLAYANEDIQAAQWYAKQLATAINATGGNVRPYGDLSGLNDNK